MEQTSETSKAPTIEDVFMDDGEVKVIISSPEAFMTVDLCFEAKEDYEKFRAKLTPWDQLEENRKAEFDRYVERAKEIVKEGEKERKTSKS